MKKVMTAMAVAMALSGVAGAQQGAPAGLTWVVSKDFDKLTGENIGRAMILSREDLDAGLIMVCYNHKLRIIYAPNVQLGLSNSDALKMWWKFSSNGQVRGPFTYTLNSAGIAAIVPEKLADGFLKDAQASKSVVMRVTDANGGQHTHTFNVTNTAKAITTLNCR